MTKYKIEIVKQTREYATQQEARESVIELLEAGVFHVKTRQNADKTPIVECKGEISTFSSSSEAANQLLRALKTHKIFFIETHISEESSK